MKWHVGTIVVPSVRSGFMEMTSHHGQGGVPEEVETSEHVLRPEPTARWWYLSGDEAMIRWDPSSRSTLSRLPGHPIRKRYAVYTKETQCER